MNSTSRERIATGALGRIATASPIALMKRWRRRLKISAVAPSISVRAPFSRVQRADFMHMGYLVGAVAEQIGQNFVGMLAEQRRRRAHGALRRAHRPWDAGVLARADFRMVLRHVIAAAREMLVFREVLVGRADSSRHARALQDSFGLACIIGRGPAADDRFERVLIELARTERRKARIGS